MKDKSKKRIFSLVVIITILFMVLLMASSVMAEDGASFDNEGEGQCTSTYTDSAGVHNFVKKGYSMVNEDCAKKYGGWNNAEEGWFIKSTWSTSPSGAWEGRYCCCFYEIEAQGGETPPSGGGEETFYCSQDFPGYTCEAADSVRVLESQGYICKTGKVCNNGRDYCCGAGAKWCCIRGERQDPLEEITGGLTGMEKACENKRPTGEEGKIYLSWSGECDKNDKQIGTLTSWTDPQGNTIEVNPVACCLVGASQGNLPSTGQACEPTYTCINKRSICPGGWLKELNPSCSEGQWCCALTQQQSQREQGKDFGGFLKKAIGGIKEFLGLGKDIQDVSGTIEKITKGKKKDMTQQDPCFLKGTKIVMADNSLKNIEKIEVGEYVLAWNEENQETASAQVLKKWIHKNTQNYLILGLGLFKKIKITENHWVMLNGKWQELGNVKPGDYLLDSKGKEIEIKSIRKIEETITSYNLHVDEYHNYYGGASLFSSGILVHNNGGDEDENITCEFLGATCMDKEYLEGVEEVQGMITKCAKHLPEYDNTCPLGKICCTGFITTNKSLSIPTPTPDKGTPTFWKEVGGYLSCGIVESITIGIEELPQWPLGTARGIIRLAGNALAAGKGFFRTINIMNRLRNCVQEVPLPGSENCESCNSDPYRMCTKERCEILGDCEAIPFRENEEGKIGYYYKGGFIEYQGEAAGEVMCLPKDCRELTPPSIKKIETEWYVDLIRLVDEHKTNGKDLKIGTKIPWDVSNVKVIVTTEKRAYCKYSVDNARELPFDEMIEFEDGYLYPTEQTANIELFGQNQLTPNTQHIIYIKCKNICGIETKGAKMGTIKFDIGPVPDMIPPFFTYVDPEAGSYVPEERASNVVVLQKLSENIKECRFSSKSLNYTMLWDDMLLYNTVSSDTVMSSSCRNNQPCDEFSPASNRECAECKVGLNLNILKQGANPTYEEITSDYIDPWVLEQLGGGNITLKRFKYVFICEDLKGNHATPEKLGISDWEEVFSIAFKPTILAYELTLIPDYTINIIEPEGSYYDRTPPIKVNTSRDTGCVYVVDQDPTNWEFNDEKFTYIDTGFDVIHIGEISEELSASIPPGTPHTIYVRCKDGFGIEKQESKSFRVLEDVTSPIVIRLLHDISQNTLHLETDESAICVYQIDDRRACKYDFDSGEIMTPSELSIYHEANWRDDIVYYVKCKNEWDVYPDPNGKGGNNPSANACSIIVHPYDVPVI